MNILKKCWKKCPPSWKDWQKPQRLATYSTQTQDVKSNAKEQGQLFHHLVAKLLYLSKCMRHDIQTAVAFLCTRVREPDTDDYKKS